MFQRTRNYAKDYERIGSTVRYKGKHYHLTMEQPALNRRKALYVLSLLAALALFFAVGFSGSAALCRARFCASGRSRRTAWMSDD